MREMTGGLVAIFVGVFAEQWAVEKRIDVLQRVELAGCPVTLGSIGRKAVLVCRTGLGRNRSSAAARAVLREHTPSAVLSVRMAASLTEEIPAGDIVLCERNYTCIGAAVSPEPAPEADRRLLTLAEQAARATGLRYSLGNALSLFRESPGLKGHESEMRLDEMAVVDAGGYIVAEAAREAGAPFLAVRAALGPVVDVAAETLMLASERGHLRPGRVALHYLPRPRNAHAFLRLTFGVKKGTKSLSAFTAGFLREWSLEP